MYYTLPMTSERKLRMKDILTNIGSQREQIELIVRTAFATAAEQLDISHDIKFR